MGDMTMKENAQKTEVERITEVIERYQNAQMAGVGLVYRLNILTDAIEVEADRIGNDKILTAIGMIREEISKALPSMEV